MYGSEDKTRIKFCTARKDREHICFAVAFTCVVSKNPKTPKFSPMADNAITLGGIGSLVSLLYICDAISLFPTATILWVLSFCVTCIGHYAPNNAQDAMHHVFLQLCVSNKNL